MNIADKINAFCRELTNPTGLPKDVIVMNPYQHAHSRAFSVEFYDKYYDDQNERTVLFGINPGRFGGGITGIPFTDPIRLATHCGIANDLDKKQELSSRFIYDVIDSYGGPEVFYNKFYFSAVSPLGYVLSGKNLNYYDIPDFKTIFETYVVDLIQKQLAFPINQQVAYCIGQGQNLKYLSYINDKYQFFDKIITIPHPRWVMQYRLKRKEEFIDEYLTKLT